MLSCIRLFLLQESPSNKLLYAKEISSYKKMVDEWVRRRSLWWLLCVVVCVDVNVCLLQLLQRHQADDSCQWPGHEHAPRRGFQGKNPTDAVDADAVPPLAWGVTVEQMERWFHFSSFYFYSWKKSSDFSDFFYLNTFLINVADMSWFRQTFFKLI